MNNNLYLGIDVGSVSTNIVLINEDNKVLLKKYIRTNGQPIVALCKGLQEVEQETSEMQYTIKAAGTTGSGRKLASTIIGADIIKNEITAHAIAAQALKPNVNTIIEIGGQDSKLIILRDNIVYDFAMNTVCAAGTGSFLDRQAERLNIAIENFGKYALKATSPVRIAGRCAVFAESDMIHKQQTGHGVEDIIAGLCEALVRNYLNNLSKGKELKPPILFQGGVAANVGMIKAFEKALNEQITVPFYYDVMGAFGAALLAKDFITKTKGKTKFAGFQISKKSYKTLSFECNDCANNCELLRIYADNQEISCWGDKCGKWSNLNAKNSSAS
ncbi:2-hydroxyglutaryl-CoA dehydratase [Clostridium sp. 'deep sea']|uniref:acyl-CoA dehydratase activase n=1 Tax=Clostridium sp. 'deep sea' TaxID=2779445 RepID=UPI0018968A2D|nr:acyl-CoA dehydratase activase [Clostridium sp. 'deep sea']QOR33641.1 2-hydroxyglutaryl-CoA dehydratase [Clostridium sp. 'deep sea']